MSLHMAEVGGVYYVFIADNQVSIIDVDSMTLEAKPTLLVYMDIPEEFEEISPLR